MFTKTDSNYLCKVVNIKEFKPHPNADRLKIATVDYLDTIVGIDYNEGIYIYFPVEGKIDHHILSELNLYSDKELNKGDETGYFGKKGRVRAMNLRGVKSFGFLLPIESFLSVFNMTVDSNVNEWLGEYFDTFNGKIVVTKYIPPNKANSQNVQNNRSRLVNGQVNLHVNTKNLRKEIVNLNPTDIVTLTYKLHGTSGWASNVLVKSKLNWIQKLISRIISLKTTEYDLIYGSRKVVKNKSDEQKSDHYFGFDLWGDMVSKYDLKNKLPKGYSIYYEIVGFANGAYIQQDYDYGCSTNPNPEIHSDYKIAKLYVYRVTYTNPDGLVYNLSTLEAKSFTEKIGLEFVPVIYNGTLDGCTLDLRTKTELNKISGKDWDRRDFNEFLIKDLEKLYNNKDCYLCNNKVPEEGIVLRVENNENFRAYKLKSANFLLKETEQLDEV